VYIGNTVYVGLGIASNKDSARVSRLPRSATSILCFCLGSFVFSRFHHRWGVRRRWVLSASFAAQFCLCVAAAVIVTIAPTRDDENDRVHWNDLLPIALVAFQSCGQAVASRALKFNALTSVVLTSIYCDLFSDQGLFVARNVERNQRAAAPLMLLVGAVVGGVFAASSVGIQGALWTATALKGCIILAWLFWPEERNDP